MSDPLTRRLSGDEIAALTFAARRQLTRWANKRSLQPRQRAQRTALIRAVRIVEGFNGGCELRAIGDE